MKLFELLAKPSSQIKQSAKTISDFFSGYDVIGTGAQAIAYLHKKFPGKIIKTVQVTGTNDPVYQFVRLALKHQDNPYFPRIYNVKLYNTKQQSYRQRDIEFSELTNDEDVPPSIQQFTMIIVMEKLQPLQRITYERLNQLGIYVDDIKLSPVFQDLNVDRQADIKLRNAFDNHIKRKEMSHTVKDMNLRRALRLMEPLFKHYDSDVHLSNIMIRPPAQWVFVDPVVLNSPEE